MHSSFLCMMVFKEIKVYDNFIRLKDQIYPSLSSANKTTQKMVVSSGVVFDPEVLAGKGKYFFLLLCKCPALQLVLHHCPLNH